MNIHLVMENRPNALVVPSAAIQSGNQGSFVWVVNTDDKGDPTAQMEPVKIALAQGQMTILDSGVTRGQKIVVDGADRLRQAAQVVVSQARQGGERRAAADRRRPGGRARPGCGAGTGCARDRKTTT